MKQLVTTVTLIRFPSTNFKKCGNGKRVVNVFIFILFFDRTEKVVSPMQGLKLTKLTTRFC